MKLNVLISIFLINLFIFSSCVTDKSENIIANSTTVKSSDSTIFFSEMPTTTTTTTASYVTPDITISTTTMPFLKEIKPVSEVDLQNMHLVDEKQYFNFPADKDAKIELYVDAEPSSNGEFLFDDSQNWMLILNSKIGIFQLFEKKMIYNGTLSAEVFIEEGEIFHVIVTESQGAGIIISDYIYNDERIAFSKMDIYEMSNINNFGKISLKN